MDLQAAAISAPRTIPFPLTLRSDIVTLYHFVQRRGLNLQHLGSLFLDTTSHS